MDDETCTVVELRRRPKSVMLSLREREIMARLADGLNCSEIARALGLSPATVRSHISEVFRLLEVRDRLSALAALRVATSPNGRGAN